MQESSNKAEGATGRAKKGKKSSQTGKKKNRQPSNAVLQPPTVEENKGKRKGAKRDSEGDARTHKKGSLMFQYQKIPLVRRRLLISPASSNDRIELDLPGAWKPPSSSSP